MVGELPGLVGLSIVCQPCHRTSSLQCVTLQHSDRGRELQNPLLALEVQFPTPADKKELNLSLIVTIHIYFFFFFIFAPCLTQLWKMKYSNTPEQSAGLRVQSGAAEEPSSAGTATGWAGNCSVTSAASLAWLWGTRAGVSTVV